jgi:hypothetical protein
VFQFFAGIHVLIIAQMQTLILNMNQSSSLPIRAVEGTLPKNGKV